MEKKLKIAVQGDVHGRTTWKQIDPDKYDKIVFVGDYVDSFDIPNVDILHNLKEIIQFKRDNMDKVTLLLGNHDVSYIYSFRCSGFRPEAQPDLSKLFNDNLDLFQMVYTHNEYIISHAGITGLWFAHYFDAIVEEFGIIREKFKLSGKFSFSEILNWLQYSEEGRMILFSVCKFRSLDNRTGVGGIIWVDKRESEYEMLLGYKQIVGHTHLRDFETHYHPLDKDTSITFIDVGDRFYEVEI